MSIKFNKNPCVAIQDVDINKVTKAYKGRAKTCCCGCAGDYAYSADGAINSNPGYEVDVRPRALKGRVAFINRAIKGEFPIDSLMTGTTFVSIEVDDKMYTAYFD